MLASAHAISRDKRNDFPVTRFANQGNEKIFPGDHSDIGRGHGSDTNRLSYAPLMYIYKNAKNAGVKFTRTPNLGTHSNNKTPHDLSPTLPWGFRYNVGRSNI